MMTWFYAAMILLASNGVPVSGPFSSEESFESKAACEAAVEELYEKPWVISVIYSEVGDMHFIHFAENDVLYAYAIQCMPRY